MNELFAYVGVSALLIWDIFSTPEEMTPDEEYRTTNH